MYANPYLIGIVGGSGAGKTTFLRDLLTQLPEKSVAVVSQDNYYLPLSEQSRDANGMANFDLPDAIHHHRLIDNLNTLMRGETITHVEYNFNYRALPAREITIEPAPVIIVEGLFVFHFQEVRELLDLRVFIDSDEQICKQRRIERDRRERGYSMEDVEYRWERHVMPAYRQYTLPYRDEAHVVVANHDNYENGLKAVMSHLQAVMSQQ